MDMKKADIIIQARQSSTRLPNKVLKKILNQEVILRLYNRLLVCKHVDRVIVATSKDNSDDKLVRLLEKNNITAFRGNLNNVLKRYTDCVNKFDIDKIIRVTADNPLVSPVIIDDIIELHNEFGYEFIDAFVAPSSPHGIGCQFLTKRCLELNYKYAKTKEEKEHVTTWIRNNSQILSLKYIVDKDIRRTDIRLALDYYEDLLLLEKIYDYFDGSNDMSIKDIIEFLNENPEIKKINCMHLDLMRR